MGQADIIDLLKKNRNKWMTTREIATELKVTDSSASACIGKLMHGGDVIARVVRTTKTGRGMRVVKYNTNKKRGNHEQWKSDVVEKWQS